MDTLLFALGSHGDVHPFVGLGQALRRRGHRVTVAANGHFGPLIERTGLDFLPIGTAAEYQAIALNADLWHPTKGFKAVAEFGILGTLRPVYDATVDFWRKSRPGEAVAVASSLALGARTAQDQFGIPLATVHLSPAVIRSLTDPPDIAGVPMPRWMRRRFARALFAVGDRFVIEPALRDPLNAFRAEVGLPPVEGIFRRYIHSPQLVIGTFPDWFAPPQPDWPPNVKLTGFPLYDEADVAGLSPELEQFLAAGAPPVAFTPGSAMWRGQAFFRASAEACRLANRRGILLTRHEDHIPADLSARYPGVVHVDYAPFSRLLPRCAALVHHGGIGTAAQALAAGVPQLVMPMAHDQPDNAARLERLGVARSVPPKRYTAPRVAAELRRLLDDPARAAACRAAAGRLRGADPVGETCALVEQLARTAVPAAGKAEGAAVGAPA